MRGKQYLIIIFALIVAVILVLAAFELGLFNPKKQESSKHPTTEPFLWVIEGENPSYLYGSIHVGTEDVLTLPDVVMNALNQADAVYTEIKLDDITTYQTSSFLLLNGETLDDILPADVASRLDSYLKTKGASLKDFNVFKIWAIAVSLAQFEYPQYFIKYQGGLDQYIWDLATSKGKETYGLETPYEQLSIFDGLTRDEQIQLLNDSLAEINNYSINNEDPLAELIDAYLDGDLDAFLEIEYQGYDESNPLYEKLLTEILEDRNYNMTERISENIINNPDKQFFFTIGAAHFIGEDNIITLLEEKGYTVTQVSFSGCSKCGCDKGEEKINDKCYIPYSPP